MEKASENNLRKAKDSVEAAILLVAQAIAPADQLSAQQLRGVEQLLRGAVDCIQAVLGPGDDDE
jgi:hypothetical protein